MTVETILEAVAQILEAGDAEKFNTNRVAEKSGYAVGTLYNYFPNKQALLRALVKREADKQEMALRRLIETEPDLPLETLIRTMLRSALRPFDERRALQRTMVGLLFSDQDILEGAKIVGDRLLPLLMTKHPGDQAEVAIARHATLGAVIGAAMTLGRHDPDLLQSKEVEDELLRLVLHGLRAG